MSNGPNAAFTPGKSFTATSGAASAATELTGGRTLELQAVGSDAAFCVGGSTVTAAAPTGTPTFGTYVVLAGQSKLITRPAGQNYVAYIRVGATSGTVYVTEGEGT